MKKEKIINLITAIALTIGVPLVIFDVIYGYAFLGVALAHSYCALFWREKND